MKNTALRNPTKFLLLALLAVACATSSSAAVITWGTATNISGTSNVVTTGTAYQAWNFGTTSNTTVNGVIFTGWAPSGSGPITNDNTVFSNVHVPPGADPIFASFNSGSTVSPYLDLSSEYKLLLGNSTYMPNLTGSTGESTRLTFTSLTVGYEYLFQVWINDSRAGAGGAINQVFTGGPSLRGNSNSGSSPAAGGTGQFATGTFTADSTSQIFEWTGTSFVYVSAAQLRVTAVPEPSVGLLLLGGLGALVLHRRRCSA